MIAQKMKKSDFDHWEKKNDQSVVKAGDSLEGKRLSGIQFQKTQ
jgi:hypothetical protein